MIRRFARLVAGALALSGLMVSPTAEAKFVFPYNHPELDWYSIETEHFVVHYSVSKRGADKGNEHALTTEWSARKSAKVAEEMWAPMCEEFNYFLKEKIHIVMLNQSDELEGFTIPPWDWIEISANPGGTFYRSRGRMEWFSDVLVHEFAHVVSLKANGTLAEGVQGVLIGGLYQDGIHNVDTGAEMFVFDGDSVFWTEGGAEYWSDNTGYNYWTASRDQNIRMTTLEDRLLTYEEWHTRSGKSRWWNDHERYYQQGYSFGQYLRQRFGDDVYARFAMENGQRGWRPNWETVVEEVVGVDAKTLYNDWAAYVRETYQARYDEVKARGEVNGRELAQQAQPEWLPTDPDARDEWMNKEQWEREKAREATGRYFYYPRVNDDGSLFGGNNGFAVTLSAVDDDYYAAFTGRAPSDPATAERQVLESTTVPIYFGDAWDFIPGQDAVVVSGTEDMMESHFAEVSGFAPEFDGYDWKQLWTFQLPPIREKDVNGRTVTSRERKRFAGHEFIPRSSYAPIPNTQRGVDPAVSPDGKKIAYFEYTDGVLNLVTINLDGTDKKYLTEYKDGTWLQQVDWSPDGSKLVFGMFRNYQQNLYTVNADGSDLKPLMVDSWEEQDAYWGKDGKIYFSADPDGIFNVYSYDVESGDIRQITNVIGGAQCPVITPDGNLLYVYVTAFGWKAYGLAKSEFMNAPANHLFETDFDMERAKADLAFQEDLSEFAAMTKKYSMWKPHNYMAPTAVPLFRLENDSQTNVGIQAGFQVFLQDYVEKHGAFIYALLGEDLLFLGQYFFQDWYPTIMLTGYHYEVKYSPGYLIDEDDDPDTTDDQTIWEIKQQQYANIGSLSMYYPWNDKVTLGAFASGMEYGFKSLSDAAFIPYLQELETGLFATFSNNAYYEGSPNPLRGRTVDLNWTHAWTDVVYKPYGGIAVDDGMLLDNYVYNKLEGRWTEQVPLPSFGGVPFLKKARDAGHVIQVDTQLGYIDRNVDYNDEFRAGGQHPYFWGSGSLRPNTQFAGFPAYSLSGETMAILNLAYRFPVDRWGFKKAGPLTYLGTWAQIGGTVGNLWSYEVPDDPTLTYRSQFDDRIAYNESDVSREVPFKDVAHKNGNALLYDLSAEIRVPAVLFHGASWNSFLRFAYGFNEVRGIGDVNGDGITDTNDSAIGDELSNETEQPGLRVYIGLGTGW